MMTLSKTERSKIATLSVKTGAAIALALAIGTPVQAQDTVVEGKYQPSALIQERVAYADLNLREEPGQLILVSRVKKAAGRVCDIIYRGQHPIMKFESRCSYKTFRDAKPQIDTAIANAENGRHVAMTLVVGRSR